MSHDRAPQPSRKKLTRKRRRWPRVLAALATVAFVSASAVAGYYYARFARLIDERMHGERTRSYPRVYARPFELRRDQALTETELVERLNDMGYALRETLQAPGEFVVDAQTVRIVPRGGEWHGKPVRVVFRPPRGKDDSERVEALEVEGQGPATSVVLSAHLVTELVATAREKRRTVALDTIPKVMREAVLAIEDRRFYDHPGVDVVRTVGAIVTNIKGDRPYLVGGSTLTQQLVKNFFLTRDKTIRRKLLEQFMALVMERRLSKDEILELYLNDVYLGQRGSFAIHGVAEAARLYFNKDISNVSLPEAATIAGLIQSPPVYSPFRAPERSKDRRNVVLHAMAEAGYISGEAAARAAAEPLEAASRGLDAEAPFFVDVVADAFATSYPAAADGGRPVDVYTTLDLHLQRVAEAVLREGLAQVDNALAKRNRPGRVQGALIAVEPSSGDVLALVGGRNYGVSQFNRATTAKRQPGSVAKPFVYLAAFETAAAEARSDISPATLVVDEPTTFFFGDQEWAPGNYGDEYDGTITLRRAIAMSRNVATARLAELVGYGRVAEIWRRVSTTIEVRAYPSIALGVFELTPWEVAEAYTVFVNGGEVRPLKTVARVVTEGRDLGPAAGREPRRVSRPDTTFLVTNMLRSVINEGTGASARAAGFALDAAGKSGTTNDLRDAWFVGFTPELLTVVWVGFDDNRAIGLSGSQAALPIWISFMQRALAGHANRRFEAPPGLVFVDIDRDTGQLAGPGCFRVISEAFLAGTEPSEVCLVHRF